MSIAALIQLLIVLLIIGLVISLIFWVLGQLGVPEPLRQWIWIAVVVIAALIVIVLLMNIAGISTGTRVLPG